MDECHCRLCAGDEPEGETDLEVAESGSALVWVAPAGERPGYGYTLGLWHSFGSPEAALFGLPADVTAGLLGTAAGRVAAGRIIVPDGLGDDVAGPPVVFPRPVLATWHPDLFATALEYYRGQPVPIVQLAWGDGDGRSPWDPAVEVGCRRSQPQLWQPRRGQERWVPAEPPTGWPFPDPPWALVTASEVVAFAGAPTLMVVHDEEGEWQFLADPADADLVLVHLGTLVEADKGIVTLADLDLGYEALRQGDRWVREPLEE